ncbi:hypothetical protein LMG22037_01809 [Paraburkholderia phenoliruptrix]|uniref:Uncharacterized protein n=1 Tax=Paraburkholderia phenoliruptrix TaxID=252970 RepID=A0A6J5AGE0_9BURK|nr:hypothetical protein LMG22037_01809 [Paraburkholderia phenoliruptrix]
MRRRAGGVLRAHKRGGRRCVQFGGRCDRCQRCRRCSVRRGCRSAGHVAGGSASRFFGCNKRRYFRRRVAGRWMSWRWGARRIGRSSSRCGHERRVVPRRERLRRSGLRHCGTLAQNCRLAAMRRRRYRRGMLGCSRDRLSLDPSARFRSRRFPGSTFSRWRRSLVPVALDGCRECTVASRPSSSGHLLGCHGGARLLQISHRRSNARRRGRSRPARRRDRSGSGRRSRRTSGQSHRRSRRPWLRGHRGRARLPRSARAGLRGRPARTRRAATAACGRRLESQHAQERHRKAGVFVRRKAEFAAPDRRDLIEQLHLFGAEHVGEAPQVAGLRPLVEHRRRRKLRPRNAVQQAREILQRGGERQAAQRHFVGDRQHRRAVALRERVEQANQVALIERAEHAAHRLFIDLIGRIGDGLVGQRKRIAHRAVGGACEEAQCLRLVRHFLLAENVF